MSKTMPTAATEDHDESAIKRAENLPESPDTRSWRRPPDPRIADLEQSAQGFTITTAGATERPPRECSVCREPVYLPSERWICEFSQGEYVTEAPRLGSGRRCRCNWCVANKDWRGPGRPAETCPGCKPEAARRKRAGERERANERHRLAAVEIIRWRPERADTDIAAELTDFLGQTVRPIRVREARRMLSAETH